MLKTKDVCVLCRVYTFMHVARFPEQVARITFRVDTSRRMKSPLQGIRSSDKGRLVLQPGPRPFVVATDATSRDSQLATANEDDPFRAATSAEAHESL